MKHATFAPRIEPLEARIAPAAVLYMSVDSDGNGLFQIDPATGVATRIGASGVVGSTVGLTETTDPYVLLGSRAGGLLRINADGSGSTQIGATTIEAMAMDLESGILYAQLNGSFFTVDPITGANSGALAGPGGDLDGLSNGKPGTLYGVSSDNGALLTYDIAGNMWSPVGPTGVALDNTGLAYDPAADVLYAKGNQDGNLYKIDPATGAATLIGATGITNGGGLALIDNGLKIVNDRKATYRDGNGDLVTVKVTQGSLEASNFLLVPAPNGGAELWRLDLSAAEFAGTKVIVTATGGDGLAHLGFLNGGANDLAKVSIPGDLARIVAGDGNADRPAVKALSVGSFGVVDVAQQLGLDEVSSFDGDLGRLTIRGDFDQKHIIITGNLGPVVIGGSLIGGAATTSGEIFASGTIASANIGGSLIGGVGEGSGRLFANGDIGPVTVLGSLQGGGGMFSGAVNSNAALGAVTVRESVIGGVGPNSGEIFGSTGIGAVKIGGMVLGGVGSDSGHVQTNGQLKSVSIGESLVGGEGVFSGAINATTGAGKVKIGGSVVGGTVTDSGRITTGGALKSLTVGGSIIGGDGTRSGFVDASGNLGALTMAGSLIGGAGAQSGSIWVNRGGTGNSGAVSIGGDIVGGAGNSGLLWSRFGSWQSVTLGGSLLGGESAFSGGILAEENLGKVTINGSVLGTATADVLIRAGGLLTLPGGATENIALTSLTVKGSVAHAQVLVGFGNNNGAINGSVEIGKVKISGNWSESSITAGHTAGADNEFGTEDDTRIAAGPSGILTSIASIIIKGAITGTFGGTDNFGFVATHIGKFKAGLLKAPLTIAATPDAIEVGFFTGDVTVREIAVI